jgi:hypothetical protein
MKIEHGGTCTQEAEAGGLGYIVRSCLKKSLKEKRVKDETIWPGNFTARYVTEK